MSPTEVERTDVAIIGAGIVGLATALRLLQQKPDLRVVLLEKEATVASHQTGHNSGVIHAGVYYQPGSLKAEFCKRGAEATLRFCRDHNLPVEQCGKLLVATNQNEYNLMEKLFERAKENQIEVEWLDRKQLKKREPNISGLGAFFVPQTGIVNYRKITNKMAELFKARGGEVRLDCEVLGMEENSNGRNEAVVTKLLQKF